MATLCRERHLTREEMKTQCKKAEKMKNRSHNHKYCFSVLTSKRKPHFRDSCQVHHGINWPLHRTAKAKMCYSLPTFSLFV